MSRIFHGDIPRHAAELETLLKINPDLKLEFWFDGRWITRSKNTVNGELLGISKIPYRLAEAKDEPDI